MAERGAALAYCPGSNMFLGDGVTASPSCWRSASGSGSAPTAAARTTACRVFEEMRMAALLQKVRHLDGTRVTAEQAFEMGTAGGAALLGLPAGEIAPGLLADLVAVDLGTRRSHPAEPAEERRLTRCRPGGDRRLGARAPVVRTAARHHRPGRPPGAGARARARTRRVA